MGQAPGAGQDGRARDEGDVVSILPIRRRTVIFSREGCMTMKYSTKLSDAVHIMIFIHLNPNMDLSSQAIAKSLKSNPSFVRQILMKLRTAGLVQSVRGRPRPKLARDPGAISLLEIYRAVEGGKRLLHLDTHINPICNIGFNIQYALRHAYEKVQDAAENVMNSITLADILAEYAASAQRLKAGKERLSKSLLMGASASAQESEPAQDGGEPLSGTAEPGAAGHDAAVKDVTG